MQCEANCLAFDGHVLTWLTGQAVLNLSIKDSNKILPAWNHQYGMSSMRQHVTIMIAHARMNNFNFIDTIFHFIATIFCKGQLHKETLCSANLNLSC